ncbi:hypothetical protein LOK49_LG13G02548 [Camellia lanceoleosa]|uniref:Uncharacterized protein n=2 Tax=Camellia lanceoleosa TaxID=1840588 RepID=A0ACC0FLM4_9ERIC|nr:hypothetical protein LOK49_LG13G02566 [Camellia lanceoleosa]KAI7988930.1 hypothetical protein LOK49_LG13G02548 [Camellia lanceoleosa]
MMYPVVAVVEVASTVTCLVVEVLGLAVVAVVVAIALHGNPVIGFALDATSTTLLAGWSVSDAMHQGSLVASPPTHHRFPIFGQGTAVLRRESRKVIPYDIPS